MAKQVLRKQRWIELETGVLSCSNAPQPTSVQPLSIIAMKTRLLTFVFAGLFAATSAWAADKAATSTVAAAKTIPVSIVAFGGTVKITGPSGKRLKAAKGAKLPLGTMISTGPNSWIDLSQGGLSTIRVKAKTQNFTIQKSSVDNVGKVTSSFKLKKGAAFVRVNKKAMKPGSKYQVQMPELIAGVVGSEGEMVDGPGGCTVVCLGGSFVGNGMPIPPGSMMVDPVGDAGPSIGGAPDNVLAMCNATMDTLPVPTGGAVDGSASGGTTDAGVTPGADGVGAAATGGDPDSGPPAGGGDTGNAPDTGSSSTDQTSPENQIADEEASPSSP